MKYKYYGTAAYEGIPSLFCDCEVCKRARKAGGRNIMSRSQSTVDDKILIDFPADTYMHTLQGLPLNKIHTCIITHDHSDHLFPYDLCARYPGYGHIADTTTLDIYACHAGIEHTDRAIAADRARFSEHNMLALHEIYPFESFTAEGYEITPLLADHGAKTDPVIYLIKKDGKCLLHAHDTGYFPNETWEYLEKNPVHMDFVSFDATIAMDLPERDNLHGHMNFTTVNNVRSRMRDMGLIDDTTICAVNHFSHNGRCDYDDVVKAVEGDGYIVAYDGLEIEF